MDELETLNMLLREIGSSPVNSLATDHPDAANARAIMDRIRKRVQRKGWWCNIDYGVDYQPDLDKFVNVPQDVSSMVFVDCNLVQRGNRVYDKVKQTFRFDDTVKTKRVVRILTWDEMPDIMQEVCAYWAASEFVRNEIEDPGKVAELQEQTGISLIDLKKQELEEGQYNIFQKGRVARSRAGVRPYARGRYRFAGDPGA